MTYNLGRRDVRVSDDFPMSIGDTIRVRANGYRLDYLIVGQADGDKRLWSADVVARVPSTNKKRISDNG